MIISNNYDYVKMFCVGMLRCWRERNAAAVATYHCLGNALKDPAVGRADLAEKYCGLQLGKDVAVA